MVMKLQFADNINENFESVATIVDFICDKMAEDNDSAILIPYSVKQAMKNGLQVRNGKVKLKLSYKNDFFISGRIK